MTTTAALPDSSPTSAERVTGRLIRSLQITAADIASVGAPEVPAGSVLAYLHNGGLGNPGYVVAPLVDGKPVDQIALDYAVDDARFTRIWARDGISRSATYSLASDTGATGYVSLPSAS